MINPRLLLVGSTGRVGSLVRLAWTQCEPEAGAVVFQTRGSAGPGEFKWDPLQSTAGLDDCLAEHGDIDAIVSLAGIVPSARQHLDLDAEIADKLLVAAAQAGIPRVIMASSSAVYGVGQKSGFAENDPCSPANDYGWAKLKTEDRCAKWRSEGLEVCAIRIGNVAGADALLSRVASASAANPLRIDRFADGRGPRRSYIGPQILGQVLLGLAFHPLPLPPVLNVAGARPVQMEDLADATGAPWIWAEPADGAHQHIELDCSLLMSLLPDMPMEQSATVIAKEWMSLAAHTRL